MANKLDRDALKGPDEFTVAVRRVLAWASVHRRALTIAGAAVGTILLVGSIASWNRARGRQQAGEQFRRAHAAYQAERWSDAAREFEDLAHDHPATSFGRFAVLYEGHALRAAGESEPAATAYEAFLARDDVGPEYQQLALLSLGQLREDAGRKEDAAGFYERAADVGGPYELEARMALARLQLALGRREDAKATYERILPEAAGDAKALVEARLAALRSAP